MELKTSIPSLVVRQFGNATPLKIRHWRCRPKDGVFRDPENRRFSDGDGSCRGLVEAQTLTDTTVCSGVSSSRPITGKVGGIKFTCGRGGGVQIGTDQQTVSPGQTDHVLAD
jgi:hypothetical protein